MGKVKNLLNGGSAAWLRLVIQVVLLGALVCIAWGRIDSRVDTNAAGVTDNREQRRVWESYINEVNTRLSYIEGALGAKNKDKGDTR